MDFKSLKSNSGKKSLESLSSELKKISGNAEKSNSDDRFWKASVDKAGNGMAIIRFLPPPQNEDVPFVRLFSHAFQGPGGWYIENSLTTIGKQDAIAEYNNKLWNSSTDDNSEERKQVRKQKRHLHFISNIYVVSDPSNPENEGKVFLFKYGKKIFDKLKEAMEPQFADEEAMNPFDLWAGANFKLKIRNVENYRNYDKSEFDKVGPLLNDDKELEKVWKSEYSLQEFISPSNFKSESELRTRLLKVLGETGSPRVNTKTAATLDEDDAPSFKATHAPKYSGDDDEDDDSIEFFKSLAS